MGGDLPKVEIADMLGISRQQLHGILAGRMPLSAVIAVRMAADWRLSEIVAADVG